MWFEEGKGKHAKSFICEKVQASMLSEFLKGYDDCFLIGYPYRLYFVMKRCESVCYFDVFL